MNYKEIISSIIFYKLLLIPDVTFDPDDQKNSTAYFSSFLLVTFQTNPVSLKPQN
ncbi:hypothetical protein MYP_6 [Sporocytophaga myxococcoides]|uniref:Uncharacterized protein n=1 Tax=Sporocytophaga myxococcoides TaxID=153721 RepID=A0A098L864_9BACT|nr:hypothetical protein MYP_6 [Sporocytophaga myxococcoides]